MPFYGDRENLKRTSIDLAQLQHYCQARAGQFPRNYANCQVLAECHAVTLSSRFRGDRQNMAKEPSQRKFLVGLRMK